MREGRIETNSICLTKQNDPEQNFSHNCSATNVKYEQCGLMTENIRCKMLKVQERINADGLCSPVSQFILASAKNLYCNFHIIFMYHPLHFPLCTFTL